MNILLKSPTQTTRSWSIPELLTTILFAILLLQSIFNPTPTITNKATIAIAILLAFKAVAWWLINNIWPVLAKYTKEEFGRDFRRLSPLQKVLIVGGFYVLLIYALIATLGAIGT